MSLGNNITTKLNSVEHFIERAPNRLFPLKVLGWLVLLFALLITNFIAIARWPLSALYKKLNKKASVTGEPIAINSADELHNIVAEQGTVLVDFWAEWCGPCLLMNKAVADVAAQYAGKITVVKVDVSLSSKLSKLYAVRGLPTVIVFKNGSEAIRKSGSLTKSQLAELIE